MQQTTADLEALITRFQDELGPLTDEQLDRKPEGGGWSAREVIAHLVVTVELYNARFRRLLETPTVQGTSPKGTHKPNWVARLLLGVLRKEGPKQKNVKAPGVFLPREELMTYDVDRLVAIHRELIDLGTQLAERRLERRKVPTPVSRLLKLAACDAYEVQALHGQRHLRQALAAAEGRAVRAG